MLNNLSQTQKRLDKIYNHTAEEPFLTASCAYSTCSKCPSGENTVIALSYLAVILSNFLKVYLPCSVHEMTSPFFKMIATHSEAWF